MHKSPASWHLESLPGPPQIRLIGRFPGRRGSLSWVLVRISLLVAWVLAVQASSVFAQDQPPPADATTQGHSAGAPISPPDTPVDLSDEVVRDVLSGFQRGFETHNLDKVLDVFDSQEMKDYAQFRDQLVAFFRLHESVKLRYQLLQVTADKDLGSAIADIEMDEDPSDILPTPQRRSTQMRFQLKREAKGWKIIGLRPTDFFSP